MGEPRSCTELSSTVWPSAESFDKVGFFFSVLSVALLPLSAEGGRDTREAREERESFRPRLKGDLKTLC